MAALLRQMLAWNIPYFFFKADAKNLQVNTFFNRVIAYHGKAISYCDELGQLESENNHYREVLQHGSESDWKKGKF